MNPNKSPNWNTFGENDDDNDESPSPLLENTRKKTEASPAAGDFFARYLGERGLLMGMGEKSPDDDEEDEDDSLLGKLGRKKKKKTKKTTTATAVAAAATSSEVSGSENSPDSEVTARSAEQEIAAAHAEHAAADTADDNNLEEDPAPVSFTEDGSSVDDAIENSPLEESVELENELEDQAEELESEDLGVEPIISAEVATDEPEQDDATSSATPLSSPVFAATAATAASTAAIAPSSLSAAPSMPNIPAVESTPSTVASAAETTTAAGALVAGAAVGAVFGYALGSRRERKARKLEADLKREQQLSSREKQQREKLTTKVSGLEEQLRRQKQETKRDDQGSTTNQEELIRQSRAAIAATDQTEAKLKEVLPAAATVAPFRETEPKKREVERDERAFIAPVSRGMVRPSAVAEKSAVSGQERITARPHKDEYRPIQPEYTPDVHRERVVEGGISQIKQHEILEKSHAEKTGSAETVGAVLASRFETLSHIQDRHTDRMAKHEERQGGSNVGSAHERHLSQPELTVSTHVTQQSTPRDDLAQSPQVSDQSLQPIIGGVVAAIIIALIAVIAYIVYL